MKKEYSSPDFEIIDFNSVVTTDGSNAHVNDGTETECDCTAYLGVDWTKV